MTLLRSSTFALPHPHVALQSRRATADKPGFGETAYRLRTTGFGATRGARSPSRRWMGKSLTTAAAVVIGGGSTVFACPVCFGAEETPLIEATQFGILVLLAITLTVQGAFVGFFLYLRRRARRMADSELDTEWSQLQSGASGAS